MSLERVVASESHLCIDCGFNTAPGFKTRAELEAAYAAMGGRNEGIEQIEQYVDDQVRSLHGAGTRLVCGGNGAVGRLPLHRLPRATTRSPAETEGLPARPSV